MKKFLQKVLFANQYQFKQFEKYFKNVFNINMDDQRRLISDVLIEMHNINCRTNKNIQTIPIFLSSDDNYAPFLCTTMFSILLNTRSIIEFYVMDCGISDKSKSKIDISLSQFENKVIHYIDMSKYDLSVFPNIAHYSLVTFCRYFIPDIAPKKIKRALYMDVDIIVKGDIAKLYNQDIDNYPLGAVLEDFYSGNYTNLKTKIYPAYNGGDKYFNAGIMLIDLDCFRQNNIKEKAVNLTIDLHDKLLCPDQDVLNILFANNFKILDYKYNYMPDMQQLLSEKHHGLTNIIPVVIHYTAGKPWKHASCCDNDFWNIMNQTEFAQCVSEKYGV